MWWYQAGAEESLKNLLFFSCSGLGDMAVSNSIGSNVFDILIGLALPWFIKTTFVSYGTRVSTTTTTYSTTHIHARAHTNTPTHMRTHTENINTFNASCIRISLVQCYVSDWQSLWHALIGWYLSKSEWRGLYFELAYWHRDPHKLFHVQARLAWVMTPCVQWAKVLYCSILFIPLWTFYWKLL